MGQTSQESIRPHALVLTIKAGPVFEGIETPPDEFAISAGEGKDAIAHIKAHIPVKIDLSALPFLQTKKKPQTLDFIAFTAFCVWWRILGAVNLRSYSSIHIDYQWFTSCSGASVAAVWNRYQGKSITKLWS